MLSGFLQAWRGSLSPQQTLNLANLQLMAASNAEEDAVAIALCEQAEISLDRVKRHKSLSATEDAEYQAFREEVATAYCKHAAYMAKWKYVDKSQASLTKSEKWRYVLVGNGSFIAHRCLHFEPSLTIH